jgi:hypothetical protein
MRLERRENLGIPKVHRRCVPAVPSMRGQLGVYNGVANAT